MVVTGVPWDRILGGIAVAVGTHLAVGTALWIYDPRHPIGSKEDALAVGATIAATAALLALASNLFPSGRLLPIWLPLAAGATVVSVSIGFRLLDLR